MLYRYNAQNVGGLIKEFYVCSTCCKEEKKHHGEISPFAASNDMDPLVRYSNNSNYSVLGSNNLEGTGNDMSWEY
jgi:hypothetical protein